MQTPYCVYIHMYVQKNLIWEDFDRKFFSYKELLVSSEQFEIEVIT